MPDISADGLTYTFKLRDAKYSNGDPIVADDLVFAWKRVLDPRTAASYQAFLGDVVGADKLIAMTGKKPAPSDADIEAALKNVGVVGSGPEDVRRQADPPDRLLPRHRRPLGGGADPGEVGQDPELHRGRELRQLRPVHDEVVDPPGRDRPRAEPELVRPRSRPSPSSTTRSVAIPTANQASFEAGELDMLAANPPDVPRIKADATLGPLVVDPADPRSTDYWGFDSSSETTYKGEPHKVQPTANKHFRRALSMAIDKDTMMATVYGGQGMVAGSPIPPGMPGHQDDIGLKYDVTAAKAELDQALTELGYSDVSEVPTLSFGFNTNAGHEITAAYMQDQWSKNLGIKSELKGETFDTFVVERPKLVYRASPGTPGARTTRTRTTSCGRCSGARAATTTRGTTTPRSTTSSPRPAPSRTRQRPLALYNQAQELLVDDAPAVFTRWRVSNYEVRAVGQGRHRHRPGLRRHRRPLLREHPDRQALGGFAPR